MAIKASIKFLGTDSYVMGCLSNRKYLPIRTLSAE